MNHQNFKYLSPSKFDRYDVHKENMFTINLEDGREAPSKANLNKNYPIIFSKLAWRNIRHLLLLNMNKYKYINML